MDGPQSSGRDGRGQRHESSVAAARRWGGIDRDANSENTVAKKGDASFLEGRCSVISSDHLIIVGNRRRRLLGANRWTNRNRN